VNRVKLEFIFNNDGNPENMDPQDIEEAINIMISKLSREFKLKSVLIVNREITEF
jgi:hypothetical protein